MIDILPEGRKLRAEPGLLAAYVEALSGVEGVTLVTVAREWDADQLVSRIGPLEELLSGPDAPDVSASPADDGVYLNALTRADAVLGLRAEPVPGIVRLTEPAELRAFVERRRRLPLVVR